MKKLFFAVAAMFVATACISEDVEVSITETNLVPVELCIEDNVTRLDVDGNTVSWEVGDKCSVMFTGFSTKEFVTFEITSASQILDNGKCAKFSGMVPVGNYLRAVAFYPGTTMSGEDNAMSEHAAQNIFMGGVKDYEDGIVVAQGKALTLTMTLEHLMHKIDYKLTGDVNHSNIAVEMVVTSNGTPVDLIQVGNYDMNSGVWSSKATTQAHFAAIHDHNFASEPIASAMVFPFEATNVTLLFNVYIDGKKQYAIEKGPLSSFKMSAGKSSTINLALTEENKVKEESSSGSSGPTINTDFGADYYLTSFMSTSAYDGNPGYIISLEGGANVTIYFTADIVTDGVLNEGNYDKYCASAMSLGYTAYANGSFSFRKNNSFFSSIGLKNSTTLQSASVKVSKDASGNYYIDLTLTDANSKTAKVQFIGELNVEDGGIIPGESGAGGSSGPVDIELTSLTAKGMTSGCYQFAGIDASGNKIDLLVNPVNATATTLSRGLVEYTTSSNASNEGLFHANNIVLNGSSRSDVVSGMMHVTAVSGNNVNMSVNLNFGDGTSQRYTFGGAIADATDNTLYLSASKTTITGDGKDIVYFTATQSGSDVTSQCVIYINGSAISGDTFSTTTAGTYTVYAMKGSDKSNEITITAEEYVVKPITLSVNKTTFIANNSDGITFTVRQDGVDISSSAEIYVNNIRNNGLKFTTNTAGTYVAYAKYDGVQSNSITLTATQPDPSNYEVVFADGVTMTSGWYDVNKVAQGNNGDINMCWAAAASNMLQWFQDNYKKAGGTLPAGCPDGPGKNAIGPMSHIYELEIMETFWNEWDNSEGGGQPSEAIAWYFEGVIIEQSTAKPKDGYTGGYWSSIWSSVSSHVHYGWEGSEYDDNLYVGRYLAYNKWGNYSDVASENRHKKFSEYVEMIFEKGMCSLALSLNANGLLHHATTLWGYEIDKTTGLVTKLYITDSDDLETEPKASLLNVYDVSYNGGNYIELRGDTRYGVAYVIGLLPFSGYGSK